MKEKITNIISALVALVGIALLWGTLIAIIIVTAKSPEDLPTKIVVSLVVVVGLGFIPYGFTKGFIEFIRRR